ncbi:MAG: hypothetical protein ACYCZ8_12935 [Acidimicrobiales bacterium]
MKRRTVSLSDEALAALDRIAKENRTTVSGVVEAAGLVLSEGGSAAEALKRRLVPDRRGGDRRVKAADQGGGPSMSRLARSGASRGPRTAESYAREVDVRTGRR